MKCLLPLVLQAFLKSKRRTFKSLYWPKKEFTSVPRNFHIFVKTHLFKFTIPSKTLLNMFVKLVNKRRYGSALEKTDIWIKLNTLTTELLLRTPLAGAVATVFSGTADEKLQHPGIIWKHEN